MRSPFLLWEVLVIKNQCFINAIISLPKNTFYATPKKTYILSLIKKEKQVIQEKGVFTYIVSEIGETRDTKRFTKDENGQPIRNDLDECVKKYVLYRNGIFDNDSERVKILDFSELDGYTDWLIEKKLSEDEKVRIGLVEPRKIVSEEQFMKSLSNIEKYLENVVKTGLPEVEKTCEYIQEPLEKYFMFPMIKGLTEKFIRNHSGDIPVYGGRQFEIPVGKIADGLSGVKYFENCLAWNREGSVGYVFYHNHKFTTNDHHRPMILKEKYEGKISLRYVRLMLQKTILSSDSFEWSKTASKEKIKKIKLSFPINSKGSLDYDAQENIADRMERYDSIINQLSSQVSKVCEAKLDYFGNQ